MWRSALLLGMKRRPHIGHHKALNKRSSLSFNNWNSLIIVVTFKLISSKQYVPSLSTLSHSWTPLVLLAHRRRSTQRTWTQLFSSRVKSELTLRSLMSTERREVSPEPPSTPKPTSQSPRSTDRINTENVASDHVASVIATAGHDKESETETTSPNRWLLAAKKISEKKKAPTQELLRRLSATKNEIVNQYESKMHNVSDKAFTSLNSKEKKSLLKANEKVQKSLNKELKLQAAIHKMAARVVIQYNITIDEALSLAETEIRDEVELSRQKKLKQKGTMKSSTAASSSQHSDTRLSSLSLEEEVKQYAHDLENNEYLDYENALIIARREVPFARAEKEKINASNNVDSTDQLFATLFKREVENDNNEKGDVKVTTIQQRDNHHDEKIVKQGNDESKADIETPLLASVEQVVGGDEAPIPQEKDKQSFKAQPPLSAPDKDKDTSNERKKETSHSSVKPADQHKPHVPNKRFSLAVGAIMKENKAKKELFKSLGKSAVMSKTAPAGVLSIHSNAEDEDEERRKESKEDIIKSNSSGGLPRQKDLKQNQELAAQNKNLSTTVGKVMTVQKLASNPFLTRAKSSVGALSRPTTSSSSSVTSAVNLLARTTITPTDRTLSMVKGPFENSNITRDEVRVNSANRDKSEKKLRKMEAKRQAETAKVTNFFPSALCFYISISCFT